MIPQLGRLNFFVCILFGLLLITSNAKSQSSSPQTDRDEQAYQELKHKGMLVQPEHVKAPTRMKKENVIPPDAIERGKGLIIPLDGTFSPLQNETLPFPIIFVHGLVGDSHTFGGAGKAATTLRNIVNLNQLKVFHVCLNHDQDLQTANLSDDVLPIGWTLFEQTTVTNPIPSDRIFLINFDGDEFQNVNNHGDHNNSNQSAIYKQGYALKLAIQSVLDNTQTSKVILVGHSMGGLAIREYLQRTTNGTTSSPHTWWIDPNDTQNGHKVARVVTIGTPHLGSNSYTDPTTSNKSSSKYSPMDLTPDENGEALRDLKYSYDSYPQCPLLPTVGIYLFGGNEDCIRGIPIINPTFKNVDINCNGVATDNIVGLNAFNGTSFNSNMPLPSNIRYTWITSDSRMGENFVDLTFCTTNNVAGDGSVLLDRQWLYNQVGQERTPAPVGVTDTLLTDKPHSSFPITGCPDEETRDAFSIIRGLDEPGTFDLAYSISLGQAIYGFVTYQHGFQNLDNDLFKITNTIPGSISVIIDGPNSGVTSLAIYDQFQNLLNGASIGSFPFTLTTNIGSGDFYVKVTGFATQTSWQNPYSLLVSNASLSVVPFTNGTPPLYRNDDGSSPLLPLSFPFFFYGTQYNSVYINNNGNLSFQGPYSTYTPTGFPISGNAMVASFWADVDTRNATSGVVYYRSEPHRFTVIWDRVGYYDQQIDKLNTFEVVISDGTDPIVGFGKNVAFSYGDMQWTTGSASGGIGGFLGTPATVGVNKGDGISYALVGRFDHAGSDYDGPGGNPDGISYLDGRRFTFNIAQGAGTISGTVFRDDNNNCVRDAGEAGVPGWTIRLEPGSQFATTDGNGNYFFSFLLPNTYTVSQVLRQNWLQTCPGSPGTHTIVLTQGQTVTGRDFGDRAVTNVQDLAASVAGGVARPGFQSFYGIRYDNKGTIPVSATLQFTIPSQVNYLSSSPGGVYNSFTRQVVWTLGSLPAGTIGYPWAKVQIPNTVPLGTVLTSWASIEPVAGDANPGDNTDVETQTVRGSFDPNDKQVIPISTAPFGTIYPTDTLTYLIRFQNTGTDTAFNITVRDLLDTDLDVSTVEPTASSHPYVFGIVDPGELVFTFADINLPDSNVNESESHGFVQFRVKPRADVQQGAFIVNDASIYFDFNAPVVTNTVQNRIYDPNLPIQLSSFTATPLNSHSVRLHWVTLSETNNYGFEVQKSNSTPAQFQTIPNSFVPGHGTTLEPHEYSFVDSAASPGPWYYRLKQIDLDGTIHYTDGVRVDILTNVAGGLIPTEFALHQNYPNPFNPETELSFELPKNTLVMLEIFNYLGEQVATIVNGQLPAGIHSYRVGGDQFGLTSGVYFYRLSAGEFVQTRKMILLR